MDAPSDKAVRNPENYVFFVTHMYYLFGEPEDGTGSSIDKNWDFTFQTVDGTNVFGAKEPE